MIYTEEGSKRLHEEVKLRYAKIQMGASNIYDCSRVEDMVDIAKDIIRFDEERIQLEKEQREYDEALKLQNFMAKAEGNRS